MSTKQNIKCPKCGYEWETFRNPVPTVDIIIEKGEEIVLIERKNPPQGWAIPGGFLDYGESAEQGAIREAKEETSLDVRIVHMLGVYSNPDRDPRQHTISTVFVAETQGKPQAADDAQSLALFKQENLPQNLAFDHAQILRDYFYWKELSKGCKEPHHRG